MDPGKEDGIRRREKTGYEEKLCVVLDDAAGVVLC
jgi:hypothetical protein